MPDIRTLLADVTQHAPHPDPVGAVQARVHRQAVRRRAGIAAGTTLTVAAAGTALALTTRTTPRPAPPVQPTPSARATTWDMDSLQRLDAFLKSHRDVFLGHYTVVRLPHGDVVHVVYAGDAAPDAMRSDIDAIAAGRSWTADRCPGTAAHYHDVYAEVTAFRWPSGATPDSPPIFDASSCKVEVDMVAPVSTADSAAAHQRWGDDVDVVAVEKP